MFLWVIYWCEKSNFFSRRNEYWKEQH
jgi:hypothetical protein